MSFDVHEGVWTTMITPFTEDGKLDFKAIEKMCRWYIKNGCDGIFTVCQSSEMTYLTPDEKTDMAKAVVEAAAGSGIQIVASGHTSNDLKTQLIEVEAMMKTGVQAYVLVSNRLDPNNEGDEIFLKNLFEILNHFPEVSFGMYECPLPYKRLVSIEALRSASSQGLVFLKDTCCNIDLIKKRVEAIKGSSLKLFNANAATYWESLAQGCAGYNGIMANYHPDLYKWVFTHKDDDAENAAMLADFLTQAAMIEMRIYPVSAKYHMTLEGIPMSLNTRSADVTRLDNNARFEVEALHRLESVIRNKLGLG